MYVVVFDILADWTHVTDTDSEIHVMSHDLEIYNVYIYVYR